MNSHNYVRHHEDIQRSNWTDEMEHFCFKVQQRIKDEKKDEQTKFLSQHRMNSTSPNFNNYTKQQSTEIPYYYSTWRSTSVLPRRLTPCDHHIYTVLLGILDHFFRRHHISYLMVDGTLLGSYTHHDFLPWDDDIDLRVASRDRQRMYDLFHQELRNVINMSNITAEFGSYDKLYFPWSRKAGSQNWSYPYVDIFYFDENSTHIWRANCDKQLINDCSMAKRDVFPLVWRPFGRIWLPAPREPLVVFELRRWTTIGELYYASNYSHKHERPISNVGGRAQPQELYPYYPWIERHCSETHCIEQLITIYNNTNITLHAIQLGKYRTELFFDPKLANKACWL